MTGARGSTEAFEAIMSDVDPPSYVVTAADGDDRAGCLVGFATQCSIDPPRFGVWLSKLNRTYRVAAARRGHSSSTSYGTTMAIWPDTSAARPAMTWTSSPASTGRPARTDVP